MAVKRTPAINELLKIMVKLRSPTGCPWDREQDHMSLRYHAVEEVYEMIDAIEAGDDHELMEELGDLLLQVVFHSQLAKERKAFTFEKVVQTINEKLLRRHPHVFGDVKVKNVDEVWANWERIKHAEKKGTHLERPSALDGIPKHLPALARAEKLVKKARKHGLMEKKSAGRVTKKTISEQLFELASAAQSKGWSAEDLLREEIQRRESKLKKEEARRR
jgi:MazG family protein